MKGQKQVVAMEAIQVRMLGRFDLIADGVSAMPYLGNSSKSILLLKYLILNKNKAIPVSEFIDVFWAEPEKSANPENALKTMVSRIRSNLAQVNPILKNGIIAEKKSYMWNPDIRCCVDVFEFEELCRKLLQVSHPDEQARSWYTQLIDLYGGDLAGSDFEEGWIVSRSLYLHHLYLKAVYRFIGFLKQEKDFETIIHVCRIALDIDTLDETLNLELMEALKEGGQNNVALMQYHHVINTYHKYLGIEPSARIQGFYKNLMRSDLAAETDIGTIRESLRSSMDYGEGAFICDYSIFRDIYQLQLRNMERQNNKMFLSLLTVSRFMDEPFQPLTLDSIMRELLEILKQCLRKGDILSRYSTSQYAILLPMSNHSNGNVVINRIKKMFYTKYADNIAKLSFQFGSIDLE